MFPILLNRIQVNKELFWKCSAYHSIQNLSKHNMSAVQPRSLSSGDEELRAVSVLASIGHRQPTSTIVAQFKVLIFETFTIDAAAWGILKGI